MEKNPTEIQKIGFWERSKRLFWEKIQTFFLSSQLLVINLSKIFFWEMSKRHSWKKGWDQFEYGFISSSGDRSPIRAISPQQGLCESYPR